MYGKITSVRSHDSFVPRSRWCSGTTTPGRICACGFANPSACVILNTLSTGTIPSLGPLSAKQIEPAVPATTNTSPGNFGYALLMLLTTAHQESPTTYEERNVKQSVPSFGVPRSADV